MLAKHLLAVVMVAASMLGVVVFVAGEGCTDATDDALADDAGVFEGGEAGFVDPCNSCLAAACLAPAALCLADDSCASVVDCDGDAGCVCSATSDGGSTPDRLHRAFTTCFDARAASCCASERRPPLTGAACDAGTTDVDGGDGGNVDAGVMGPDICVNCAGENCATAVAICGNGSECEAFLACSSACTTSSCITDCGTLHATGKVAASELATCTATSCKNECEL